MFNKKLLFPRLGIVILLVSFCFSFANYGQASLLDNIICAQKEGKTCSLNDFVQVIVNVAEWILGITGSLALLFFIYGGVMFLISSGNSEKIEKAKHIIISAVIGLLIVFASFMIIQFTLTALGVPGAETGSWATSGWFGK